MASTRLSAPQKAISDLTSLYSRRTIQKHEVHDVILSIIENPFWPVWQKDEKRRLVLTICRTANGNKCLVCHAALLIDRQTKRREVGEETVLASHDSETTEVIVLFVAQHHFHHTCLPLPEQPKISDAPKTALSDMYWPVAPEDAKRQLPGFINEFLCCELLCASCHGEKKHEHCRHPPTPPPRVSLFFF